MDKVKSTQGTPEEVERYDSSSYHSVDWWYWSKGICYTFTWGKNVEECCDISTYRFESILTNSSESIKNIIKKNKKL
jgi:hypothetical protein